jgi:hypothetical protein
MPREILDLTISGRNSEFQPKQYFAEPLGSPTHLFSFALSPSLHHWSCALNNFFMTKQFIEKLITNGNNFGENARD